MGVFLTAGSLISSSAFELLSLSATCGSSSSASIGLIQSVMGFRSGFGLVGTTDGDGDDLAVALVVFEVID